jgi:hypothetical protein
MIPNIRTHPKSTNFTRFYPSVFRRHAHILIAYGYKAVRPTLNENTEEPTITIRIYQWIKKSLKEYKNLPDIILDCRYNILAEPPLIEEIDIQNIKDTHRFLDIVVEDSQFIPRQEIIFEGKRLKKGDFTIVKYCKDGVVRFVDNIYGVDSSEAVLIGFWQDGNVKHWLSELKRSFTNDSSGTMKVKKNLRSVKIISDFPHEWISRHGRSSGKDIILFHIFLDCSKLKSK